MQMPQLSLLFALTLLSGCLATTDLTASNSSLKSSDRRIAEEISNLVETTCTTYKHRPGSPEKPITGQVKVRSHAEVKRLYQSGTEWYKAEVAVPGAWGNVYYNSFYKQLVCGDVQWGKVPSSPHIQFVEIQ